MIFRYPFKKKGFNNRAVSVAIANVIMVAVVLTVGLSITSWSLNVFDNQQSAAAAEFLDKSAKMKEILIIEDIWFYGETDQLVNITLRNVGTVEITVSQIDFKEIVEASEFQVVWTGEKTIAIDGVETVPLTLSWNPGEYLIQVLTARENLITEHHYVQE